MAGITRFVTSPDLARFKTGFMAKARGERMALLLAELPLRPGARVLDLGGTPSIWRSVETPLRLTTINLEGDGGVDPSSAPQHEVERVVGDACELDHLDDGSYDVVFSNSVIEHVGDAGRRAAFAANVRRLAPRYWVQTPSKWFPIEAHCNVPFWFFLPQTVRERVMDRWSKRLPAWTEMVRGTTVLERKEMISLFPDARLLTERTLGWPKSYVACRA